MGLEFLDYTFFRNALLLAILSSIASGIIGSLIVAKDMPMFAGGIAHAALGGVGAAILFEVDPFFGSLIFAICSAIAISIFYFNNKDNIDALIALVWTSGMSIGLVLGSLKNSYLPNLNAFVFGSIALTTINDVKLGIWINIILIISILLFYRQLQWLIFDEEFSLVRNRPVKLLFTGLMILTALAVVLLTKILGIILVIGLVVIPPLIAKNFALSLLSMMIQSIAISVLVSITGLYITFITSFKKGIDLPVSALISLLLVIVYIVALFISKKRNKHI